MEVFYTQCRGETELVIVIATSKIFVVNFYGDVMLAIMNGKFPHSIHR